MNKRFDSFIHVVYFIINHFECKAHCEISRTIYISSGLWIAGRCVVAMNGLKSIINRAINSSPQINGAEAMVNSQ